MKKGRKSATETLNSIAQQISRQEEEDRKDITVEEKVGETPSIPVSQEVSLHDKYRKYINMTREGYLRGLSYEEAMEMLRWIEKVTGKGFPINYSCGTCMVDLVKRFAMLEGRV